MTQQEDAVLKAQGLVVAASCAATNLRRASRVVNQHYAQVLGASGLEPTQFTLLVTCAVAGDLPITALAEVLAVDRTTLARNLKPLEKQGLIQVVAGEDRRVRIVRLTEPGRQCLARALPLWKQAQEQVVAAFGQNRLSRLLEEAAAIEALTRQM